MFEARKQQTVFSPALMPCMDNNTTSMFFFNTSLGKVRPKLWLQPKPFYTIVRLIDGSSVERPITSKNIV